MPYSNRGESELPLEISYCDAGEADLEKLSQLDSVASAHMDQLVLRAEAFGWALSLKTKLIKVFKDTKNVGEIRRDKPGSAHRAIFFWVDTEAAREIHITAIAKKSILKRSRLNTLVDTAASRREQYVKQGDC